MNYMPFQCEEDIFVCGARQALAILKSPYNKEKVEIALGILANTTRKHSVFQKALHNRVFFTFLFKVNRMTLI